MGAKSTRKGKVGERQAAALLRAYGFEARRGQQYSGSPDSPDVVHSIPRVHIEVKFREKLNLYEALEKAYEDKDPEELAIIIHRRKRRPWLVTMLAEDYLKMMAGDAVVKEYET